MNRSDDINTFSSKRSHPLVHKLYVLVQVSHEAGCGLLDSS
jgi:hypothetical protein